MLQSVGASLRHFVDEDDPSYENTVILFGQKGSDQKNEIKKYLSSKCSKCSNSLKGSKSKSIKSCFYFYLIFNFQFSSEKAGGSARQPAHWLLGIWWNTVQLSWEKVRIKTNSKPTISQTETPLFERHPQKCVAKHVSILPTVWISPFKFQISSF